MGLIEYYFIFALTTSIFALIDIFLPILNEARAAEVNNVLTENPKLSCLVYFCISTIMAPLLILPMLVPSMNERFRNTMHKVINEEE